MDPPQTQGLDTSPRATVQDSRDPDSSQWRCLGDVFNQPCCFRGRGRDSPPLWAAPSPVAGLALGISASCTKGLADPPALGCGQCGGPGNAPLTSLTARRATSNCADECQFLGDPHAGQAGAGAGQPSGLSAPPLPTPPSPGTTRTPAPILALGRTRRTYVPPHHVGDVVQVFQPSRARAGLQKAQTRQLWGEGHKAHGDPEPNWDQKAQNDPKSRLYLLKDRMGTEGEARCWRLPGTTAQGGRQVPEVGRAPQATWSGTRMSFMHPP